MADYQDILVDKATTGVVTISLNRPKARNALTTALLGEIADLLDQLKDDADARCVVITGNARLFAAGADLQEMIALDQAGVANDIRPQHWARITAFPKPIIAAVNGFALGGGCELAMHADIIIAGSNAQFGQPEINLGIIPGAGGTQRLLRAVGKSLASKLVLSGEFIDAETALAAGLVAEICQPELTVECAQKLAKTIATKAPLAVQQAKAALQQAFELPLTESLKFERAAFVELAGTDDRNEGIRAFLEKRKPEFKGS